LRIWIPKWEHSRVVFYHLNLEPCHTFASTKDFQTYKYFNSKTFIPFIALLRIAYLSSMYIRSRLVFCGKNLPKCPRCPFTSNRFWLFWDAARHFLVDDSSTKSTKPYPRFSPLTGLKMCIAWYTAPNWDSKTEVNIRFVKKR